MEENDSKQYNINLFIKLGIVVLSIIIIVGAGMRILPGAISVTSTGNKKDLPIYCVNTNERKVALTFDVAWGNG